MNNKIMDYLSIAEGDRLHKNRTESHETSAYGIYRRKWPHAEIWDFYEEIAELNGIPTNFLVKKNRDRLNAVIEADEELKHHERMIAWMFFKRKFMNEVVNDLVSDKIELTFFSLAVNGGMRRAIKALQYAIRGCGEKIIIDGIFGQQSYRALVHCLASDDYSDDKFNKSMLDYMQGYYDYLIRVNPRKYARYKRGWHNRLEALV